jgi:hypothetical protein
LKLPANSGSDADTVRGVFEIINSSDKEAVERTVVRLARELGLESTPLWLDPAFRIYVALVVSPRAAICYDILDPKPRWVYIFDHLKSRTSGYLEEEVKLAARRLASILDDHERGRGDLPVSVEELISKRGNFCAICNNPFFSSPEAVIHRDPYRPLWSAPQELCRPEVDHINPVRWSGVNNIENLQILCRACNSAKSDGLRMYPHQEAIIARMNFESIPRIHFFRMLVVLAAERGGRCEIGGCENRQLTIRPRHRDASFLRCNSILSCYQCYPVQKLRCSSISS